MNAKLHFSFITTNSLCTILIFLRNVSLFYDNKIFDLFEILSVCITSVIMDMLHILSDLFICCKIYINRIDLNRTYLFCAIPTYFQCINIRF
jgi:hypothetical protein